MSATKNVEEETLLSKCEIPIIDLAHIGTEICPMKSVVRRVGVQLHKALSEKGMAMLVNHGISDDKLKAVYADLDNFCALPKETQERFVCNPQNNNGYIKPGVERFDGNIKELRHSFNITSLAASDLPEETLVPHFSEHAAPLAEDFTNLSRLLLKSLAVALSSHKLPPQYFLDRHACMMSGRGDNASTMRLLYYPPVPPSDAPPAEQPDNYTRCGAHVDHATFTLLAQDCEGGLEVKLPGRAQWQPVGHLPGALLVQTGDLLAAWTSNIYPALLHRVIIPKHPYSRSRGRHCVAFFCQPDACCEMSPLPAVAVATVAASTGPACAVAHRGGLQHRFINACHHLQKRFKETYA